MSHFEFQLFHLSGSTVWPQASFFKNSPKLTNFSIFNEVLFTQNVNVARFARNVEWDFFYDFQTPWWVGRKRWNQMKIVSVRLFKSSAWLGSFLTWIDSLTLLKRAQLVFFQVKLESLNLLKGPSFKASASHILWSVKFIATTTKWLKKNSMAEMIPLEFRFYFGS